MVERLHRQLKNSLHARLASSDWFEHMPWVLLGLHTSPREDSATATSERVYGSVLTLPGQFLEVQDPPINLFYENLKNSMSGFQPTPPCHNTPAAHTLPEVTPAELSACPMVFIRKDGHYAPLSPIYQGPYEVLSRSPKTFQLQVGKRVEVVSVQRLKPAFTADDEAPVEPPRRGRPRCQPPPVPPDPPRQRGRPPCQPPPPPPDPLRRRGRPLKAVAEE